MENSGSSVSLVGEVVNLHQRLRLFERQAALLGSEWAQLFRLLECQGALGDWERVVDLASQGIVIGCSDWEAKVLYRAWIEALHEDHHVEGLRDLGRHLMARRKECVDYVALGMLALSYSGQVVPVRIAYGHLHRTDAWTPIVAECMGLVLCQSIERADRVAGLKMLWRANRRPVAGYFSLRAAYREGLESDCNGFAVRMLKRINSHFPQAPEPYHMSAMISVSEGDWLDAEETLDVVNSQNPFDSDSILWKARCLELRGEVEQARALLARNADMFDPQDYEFNVAMGMLGLQMAHDNTEMAESSAEYLERALAAAPHFHMPESPLVAALENLGVYSKSEQTRVGGAQRYWLLSINSKTLSGLLGKSETQIRCPAEMDVGDVVFFAAEERTKGTPAVSGFFRVESTVFYDPNMGPMVRLSNPTAFEADVQLHADSYLTPVADLWGGVNFSTQRRAFYFELQPETVEAILERVEEPRMTLRKAG